MYEAFFALARRPFVGTPDPGCWFSTELAQLANDALLLGLRERAGVAILSGAAGIGKTLLCERLVRKLGGDHPVVFLRHPRFATRRSLLQTILGELELPFSRLSEQELRQELEHFLRQMAEQQHLFFLICDEAHLLDDKILEELRALSDIHFNGQSVVRLLLAGELELEERLAMAEFQSLAQRVTTHAALETLNRAESHEFLDYRLTWAGGRTTETLSPEALSFIVEVSGGSPRCLCLLADHSLLLAFAMGEKPVSLSAAESALNDLKHLSLPWNLRLSRSTDIDEHEPTHEVTPESDHPVPPESQAEQLGDRGLLPGDAGHADGESSLLQSDLRFISSPMDDWGMEGLSSIEIGAGLEADSVSSFAETVTSAGIEGEAASPMEIFSVQGLPGRFEDWSAMGSETELKGQHFTPTSDFARNMSDADTLPPEAAADITGTEGELQRSHEPAISEQEALEERLDRMLLKWRLATQQESISGPHSVHFSEDSMSGLALELPSPSVESDAQPTYTEIIVPSSLFVDPDWVGENRTAEFIPFSDPRSLSEQTPIADRPRETVAGFELIPVEPLIESAEIEPTSIETQASHDHTPSSDFDEMSTGAQLETAIDRLVPLLDQAAGITALDPENIVREEADPALNISSSVTDADHQAEIEGAHKADPIPGMSASDRQAARLARFIAGDLDEIRERALAAEAIDLADDTRSAIQARADWADAIGEEHTKTSPPEASFPLDDDIPLVDPNELAAEWRDESEAAFHGEEWNAASEAVVEETLADMQPDFDEEVWESAREAAALSRGELPPLNRFDASSEAALEDAANHLGGLGRFGQRTRAGETVAHSTTGGGAGSSEGDGASEFDAHEEPALSSRYRNLFSILRRRSQAKR
jgi:type II secretory pathway predicted ATPase ExeA